MPVTKTGFRFGVPRCGRVWRVAATVLIFMLALTCWLAASAAATVIKVDTTAESALFDTGTGGAPEPAPPDGPHPVYSSRIVGLHHSDKCSLREAVEAANTHQAVGACPAGSGNDTIELMPGTYPVWDNFFILEKMTFRGPNAGLAGNDPKRRREAVLSFDYNPNWAAQVSMFWLGKGSGGQTEGAGSVFDGLVLQGNFVPNCAEQRPCEIVGIIQPSLVDEHGETLTDSILRHFSFGVYLGGTDTITRNVFERMDQNPASSANGFGIYSDFVYTSQGSIIEHNVFNNPRLAGVLIQGNDNRGTVDNAVIADNVFLKKANDELGAMVLNSTGDVIKNNLFLHRNPKPFADRRDAAILLDKDTNIQITGNTIVGWQRGISIGPVGNPGPPGSTDITVAFNRIWNNTYGFRVTPSVFDTPEYGPLAVDANDNWWGSNGGPGSTGARPGAINPVNGVQFFASDGTTPVPNQGGITVDRSLQLTCSAPATVQVNVPAPVVGQVVGMPTVDVTSSTPPWFIADSEPFMAASAPGLGNVFGFDRVPNQGPDNAQLTGTLLATNTGSGDVLVDLDSERVACPVTVTPGPNPIIDKKPDSPTVTAGGLAGYRITVTNRSRVTARNWWACDRIPRHMTFVRSSRKLRRLGRLRCLVIPTLRPHHRVSFHLTLRVAPHTPNTTVTNIGEVIPGNPSGGTPPGNPGGRTPPARVPIIGKAKAKVKVKVRPPIPHPPPPRVTG